VKNTVRKLEKTAKTASIKPTAKKEALVSA
jgi:hypothetical protein